MSHEIVNINCGTILQRGRFKAVRHTGHTYDDDGNIVKHGEILEETGWGRNTMTLGGFDYRLGRNYGGNDLIMICGPSNTPPVEGDTAMGDALGFANVFASVTIVGSNTDPLAGPLYRTVRHTRTFAPGRLGGSAVNVSMAGIVHSGGNISPTLTQLRAAALMCAGLLVDSSGDPTSISVLPTDYLDVTWEHTEFIPFEATGTFNMVVDGVDVPTDYVVRPAMLFDVYVWGGATGAIWYRFPMSFNKRAQAYAQECGVRNGSLSAVTTSPFPSNSVPTANQPTSIGFGALTNGSKQRQVNLSFAPTQGNIAPNINTAQVRFYNYTDFELGGQFQISYDPPIEKTAAKQLQLNFVISMANAP